MNRMQRERYEIDREIGAVPKILRHFEVLIEQSQGNYKGTFKYAHGFDERGVYTYVKAHKKPGYRFKRFHALYANGRHVMVIDHGEAPRT